MFIKSTTLTLLALRAISVSAQNATAQEINGVVANYEGTSWTIDIAPRVVLILALPPSTGAQLIPSFLPSLEPQGLLNVAFNGTEINLGDALTSESEWKSLRIRRRVGLRNGIGIGIGLGKLIGDLNGLIVFRSYRGFP